MPENEFCYTKGINCFHYGLKCILLYKGNKVLPLWPKMHSILQMVYVTSIYMMVENTLYFTKGISCFLYSRNEFCFIKEISFFDYSRECILLYELNTLLHCGRKCILICKWSQLLPLWSKMHLFYKVLKSLPLWPKVSSILKREKTASILAENAFYFIKILNCFNYG